MENKLDKVMDRIRKLLSLSTSNNPNEAATAAAQAAKLMADYELEEADLRVESGEANLDKIEQDVWYNDSKNGAKWKGMILVGVVKGFGCYAYQSKVRVSDGSIKSTYCVIGRSNNVRTANYMFQYLTKEIQDMCERAWLALRAASEASMYHGKHWKNSFLLGAAVVIQNRLIEQSDANKVAQAQSKGCALIKRDQAEVDAYYQRLRSQLNLRQAHSQSRMSRDAYEQGKEAGASVNLGGNAALGSAPRQIAGC